MMAGHGSERERPEGRRPARGGPATLPARQDSATNPLAGARRPAHLPSRPSAGTLRYLQHSLGNRALARAISGGADETLQRAPLSPEEQGRDLANEPYASNERLQSAYDNNPPLRSGESGAAVVILQQGLLDNLISLPLSTQNGAGEPDGIYGAETAAGVRQFQQRHGLDVDGVAGRQTLGELDSRAGSRPEASTPGGQTQAPVVPPQSDIPQSVGDEAAALGPGTQGEAAGFTTDAPPEVILAVLEYLNEQTLYQLRQNTAFVDYLQNTLSPAQFGRAAACFCLSVPAGVQHQAEAKQEALRLMGAQLSGDKQVARRALERIRGIIIPANSLTTQIVPFQQLAGGHTMDGRPWESVRGITIGREPYEYAALPEDNLLGIPCTATWVPTSGPNAGIPQTFHQDPEGFSSATHEFAHALHGAALTDVDRATIEMAFARATRISNMAPTNGAVWVDGPRGCYASLTSREFFAQLSNAYLGTNTGTDVATGYPRHNGKLWVLTHEPEIYAILERIYAGADIEGANPVSDPLPTGGTSPTSSGTATGP